MKIGNSFVETIIIEQFDFERNAKMTSGFEHISSKIRDMEKNILLIVQVYSDCHDSETT